MLNYAERFYERQFLTRKKKVTTKVLDRLEQLINAYFGNEALCPKDLPTVQYISSQLNIPQSFSKTRLANNYIAKNLEPDS